LKCHFIPIQNVSYNSPFLNKNKGISKYKTNFLVDSYSKYKKCKGINKNNTPIVFAVSDEMCHIKFCIYNQFYFTVNLDWFKSFFDFDKKITEVSIHNINNLQDFLLLLEMIILRNKYKNLLKKNYPLISINKKNLWVNFSGKDFWPFNKTNFSVYWLFYVLVYIIYTKPLQKKKKIILNEIKFKYSWSSYLRNQLLNKFNIDKIELDYINFN
jgi:hypothetical protein